MVAGESQQERSPRGLTAIPPMSGFESILAEASSKAVPLLSMEKSKKVDSQTKPFSPGAEHVLPIFVELQARFAMWETDYRVDKRRF